MKTLFVLLQRLLPQHLLSRLAGTVAEARSPWLKNALIRLFIRVFNVDMAEAELPGIRNYENFNAFFARRLKAGSRPIAGSLCSPADGTVSATGNIDGDRLLQAKGIDYSLENLLATTSYSPFRNGSFATIYLSPRDYHRVHMPVAAELRSCRYVPGKLFSVNEATTASVPGLFTANERLVCHFENETGPMVMVMVGAMIVAAIQPVWRSTPWTPREPASETFEPAKRFRQGDEFASFMMGSTVILVLPGSVPWCVSAGEHIRFGQPLVKGGSH